MSPPYSLDNKTYFCAYCSWSCPIDGDQECPNHDSKQRPHINKNGQFQSDKYPTCPAGKVPLSVADPMAQDLLWEYAQRRREVDAQFADDLEYALRQAGYKHHPSQCLRHVVPCVSKAAHTEMLRLQEESASDLNLLPSY
jgi:hypothetical protein